MSDAQDAGNAQVALWNGAAGQGWVEAQAAVDAMFAAIEDLLVDAAVAASATRVLDVGCGTGGVTVAVARQVGAGGAAVGVDISGPMLAAARARAAAAAVPARFVQADAGTHDFAPASHDMVVSRFGVMFFDDPVAAFANLRRATRAGGGLRFAAWRDPAENAFMTVARRAAAPLLPDLPTPVPNAAGQFGFADRDLVHGILAAAGWAAIDIQPLDAACSFPAADLDRFITRLGPVGRMVQDVDEATRTRVIDAVRAAYAPYVHGGEVRFTAACWDVSARA